HTGNVKIGSNLIISYVQQDNSHLQGSASDFAEENHIDESLFKTVLSKLNFDEAQFSRDMQNFSEGQKKKVLIAKSLCEQAHLYVWDEPLNFIDVYSRMQLERLIKQFSPTMILVEHDRAFREMVATKRIEL
ncbi:MAG: ATP-binding cassette domain-containing protein, partial [Eubacterium sp.]|nr:ATP-binding cassette domain-containing protein [Eubacterium sp.]